MAVLAGVVECELTKELAVMMLTALDSAEDMRRVLTHSSSRVRDDGVKVLRWRRDVASLFNHAVNGANYHGQALRPAVAP